MPDKRTLESAGVTYNGLDRCLRRPLAVGVGNVSREAGVMGGVEEGVRSRALPPSFSRHPAPGSGKFLAWR